MPRTMPRAGCAAVALPLPIQEEEPELDARRALAIACFLATGPCTIRVRVEGEDEEQEEEVWMPWAREPSCQFQHCMIMIRSTHERPKFEVMVIGGYGADAGQSTEVLSVQAWGTFRAALSRSCSHHRSISARAAAAGVDVRVVLPPHTAADRHPTITSHCLSATPSRSLCAHEADTARPGPKLRSRRACCAAAMPAS